MYAVMKTGGKQYRVEAGDVLRIEKIAGDAGETIQFDEVLMLGRGAETAIGTPLVDGAAVQAEVIDQIKGPKTISFVKRRRKHGSKRTRGHRQQLTLLRITDILEAGATPRPRAAAEPKERADAAPAPAERDDEAGAGGMAAAAGTAMAGAAAAVATVAAANAEVAADAMKAVASAVDGATGTTEGTEPGNLMSEAPAGGGDDLKRLSGVGPKLAAKLNENGVWTFAQIAAWTPEEVAFMDDRLSFKGRIARDGWTEQASRFDAEKSGASDAGEEE